MPHGLKPGDTCPHCGQKVRGPRRYSRHPKREARVIRLLTKAGRNGLTDDEVDAITRWRHQSATPVMNTLRDFVKSIGWDRTQPRRKTRMGGTAGVNVLAKYLRRK